MLQSGFDGRRGSALPRTNPRQTFGAQGRYRAVGTGGDIPGWLEAILAAIGLFMGIITGAISAAWRVSSLIYAVEKRLTEQTVANREAMRKEVGELRDSQYAMHAENRTAREQLRADLSQTKQDVAVIASRLQNSRT